MDWLLQHLSDLPSYWNIFTELCTNYPWITAILAVPFVLVFGFTAFNQSRKLIRRAKVLFRSNAGRWVEFGGLAFSCVVSAYLVLSIRAAHLPRPVLQYPTQVIGKNWTLEWSFHPADQQVVRYEIQEANTVNFDSRNSSRYYSSQCFQPVVASYDGDTFWRVRALDAADHVVGTWSTPAKVTQYDTSLKRIEATGVVRIYVSGSFNQGYYSFQDYKGVLSGFEPVMMQALIDKLSVKLGRTLKIQYTPVDWKDLLAEPSTYQSDIIISSITKTKEREAQFAITFSETYQSTTYSLVYLPEQESKVTGRAAIDLIKSASVAVQDDTSSFDLLNGLNRTLKPADSVHIKPYQQIWDAITELEGQKNQIDYIITDTPFAEAAKLEMEHDGLDLLHFRPLNNGDFPSNIPLEKRTQDYAMAVRKGNNDLLSLLNSTIDELKQDGELQKFETQEQEHFKEFCHGVPIILAKAPVR